MTGVGKTDLVRRLVKALDRQDRFCEVELSNGDSTSYWSSVGNVLDGNYVNDEEPKIVLFDEIQRFNTLDVDSKPLANTKFTDFWELLSDGRLAKRNRDDTLAVLTGYSVWLTDARPAPRPRGARRAQPPGSDRPDPLEALMNDHKRIQLRYDADSQSLVAKLGKDVHVNLP